jgi:hypothetical protein
MRQRKPVFDIILAALIGVYGNLLIAFIDRASLPKTIDLINSIYTLIIFITLAIFVYYLVFSYFNIGFKYIFWFIHAISMLIVFFIKYLYLDIITERESNLISNFYFWMVSILLFGFIYIVEFYGSGDYEKYLSNKRWKSPMKIGILNDMGGDTTNPDHFAWTNINPMQWKMHFSNFTKMKIELINNNSPFDKYTLILNPYGSIYPEKDLGKLTTLDKISDYVENGGIYLSISDIPSYFAYDINLERKLDTTTPIYDPNTLLPIRVFTEAPLMKKLGLITMNFDQNPRINNFPNNLTIYSRRASFLVRNMEPLIPTTFIGPGTQFEVSSFFSLKYGEGEFIFSMIWITDQLHYNREQNFLKKLISAKAIQRILRYKKNKEKNSRAYKYKQFIKNIKFIIYLIKEIIINKIENIVEKICEFYKDFITNILKFYSSKKGHGSKKGRGVIPSGYYFDPVPEKEP